MKKISILSIAGLAVVGLTMQSCQQEASSSEIEAKVAELYQAQKLELENSLAAACDSAVDARVAQIIEEEKVMNEAQQKAHLEKIKRELAAHKRKAKLAAQKKKVVKPVVEKPIEQVQKEVMTKKAEDKFNDGIKVETKVEETKKANSKFGN